MFAIFDRAKSEGRGLVGNSHTKGVGANSPAMLEGSKKAQKASLVQKNGSAAKALRKKLHAADDKGVGVKE